MRIIEMFQLSFKQIRKHFLESFLIICGIALGIAVVTGVIGLTEGYERQFVDYANSPSFRIFQLTTIDEGEGGSIKNLRRGGIIEDKRLKLTYDDYLKLRKADIPGIEYIWLSSFVKKQDLNLGTQVGIDLSDVGNKEEIVFVTPDFFKVIEAEIEMGSVFTEHDVSEASKVVIMGKNLALARYPPAPPDPSDLPGLYDDVVEAIGSIYQGLEIIGVVNFIPIDRVNVVEGIGQLGRINRHVFVPYFTDVQGKNSKNKDDVNSIYVTVAKNQNVQTIYGRLKRHLDDNYAGQVYLKGNYLQKDRVSKSNLLISNVIGFFAIAGLLIASINILNLMLAKILRRNKYIGLSMALGASKLDVFKLFLVESVLLGLLGLILGLGLASGGSAVLSQFIQIPIYISFGTVLVAIGLAIFTGVVFGLYPAYQASQINPVDVIRGE